MASFIFIYRAGPDPVTADRIAENRAAWGSWNAELGEEYGIRTAGGKLVTAGGVTHSDGTVRGASMVEFDSMDAAVDGMEQADVSRGAPTPSISPLGDTADIDRVLGSYRRVLCVLAATQGSPGCAPATNPPPQ